jgi:hypothetical protein
MRRVLPYGRHFSNDLRQRRAVVTADKTRLWGPSTPPEAAPMASEADEFGTLRPYMEFDKDGSFNGTITARDIDPDALIDLFATIMVKPGLVETIKVLDLSNPDAEKIGLITAIPRLKGFTGLQVLKISGQQLRSIPEGWLDDCLALRELDLGSNQLQIIPAQLLKNCTALEQLYLKNNKLTAIPADFVVNCKKLVHFDHDNILVTENPVSEESKTIKDFRLEALKARGVDPSLYHSHLNPKARVVRAGNISMQSSRTMLPQSHDKPIRSLDKPIRSSKNTPPPRPTIATVQITAAEHAELMNSKANNDKLAQAVADQAKELQEMKNQIRDLNSRSAAAPVPVKPVVTAEERALFVKADTFEANCVVVLQDSRATTVNVMLEQANVLMPQNLAQSQAMANKIQELIWGVRNAEERASNAEEIARMAIAELRRFKAETEQNIKFLSEKMTENEEYLYEAIVRINKLGRGFTVLSAEIGKNNQYATICNALNEGKHHGAAAFIIAFVAKFTGEHTFATLAAQKKFKFDYGVYGMVSDSLIAIANLVPVAGVGAFATAVQMTVKSFEDKKKVANANKIVKTTGRIVGGPEELATRIAVSILQLNGHIIAKCSHDVANSIAKLCFDAAIKYITATPKDQIEISAEEIAYALMNGKFLDPQSSYRGYVLSFDSVGNLLTTRANPDKPTKAREWLSDTLMEYGNNPERFDDMLALPNRTSIAGSRASWTPRFTTSKMDEQKMQDSPRYGASQQRFEIS